MPLLSKLFVTLGLQSKDFMKGIKTAVHGTEKLGGKTDQLGKSLTTMKRIAVGAFVGWGINRLAGTFLEAAKTTEGYKVRLNTLLGSVKEGNRAFAEMSKFATTVSFSYEEVMASATTLSGVMSGGVDEISRWMPMITDLAAVSGLTIQETTGQIVRMYSAGAGAADLFRERGILQMLGFKAGVSVTAEETKKILIDSWEKVGSKWKGVSEDLAKTWSGTMSMLGDMWFQFRNMVMDEDVFEFMKNGAQLFLASIKEMQETGDLAKWAKDTSTSVLKSFEIIIKAAALVGDTFRGWKMIWMGLKVAYDTFLLGILEGSEVLIRALRFGLEKLGQDKAVNALNRELIILKDTQRGAVISIEEGVKAIEDFVDEGSNYSKVTKFINDLKKETVKTEKATVKLSKTTSKAVKLNKVQQKQLFKELQKQGEAWEAFAVGSAKNLSKVNTMMLNETSDEYEGFFGGVKQGFDELEDSAKDWADHGRESVFQFTNDTKNAFADFINPLRDDFLSLGSLWDTMLNSMVASATRILADEAIKGLLRVGANLLGGGIPGAGAGAQGPISGLVSKIPVVGGVLGGIASVFGFHEGGVVGGSGNIPIIAQSGEGILTRQATANVGGEAGINALNRGEGMPVVVNVYIGDEQLNTRMERVADGVRVKAEKAGFTTEPAYF